MRLTGCAVYGIVGIKVRVQGAHRLGSHNFASLLNIKAQLFDFLLRHQHAGRQRQVPVGGLGGSRQASPAAAVPWRPLRALPQHPTTADSHDLLLRLSLKNANPLPDLDIAGGVANLHWHTAKAEQSTLRL